jgi:hypothetical protein
MRQLPCRLIELILIFVMMSLQLILQRIFSFNILRMSPSVMIPITLSCSITAVTPRRFSEISKSLFLSAYQENHRF